MNRHLVTADLVWLNLIPLFDLVWIRYHAREDQEFRAGRDPRASATRAPANESAFNVGLCLAWLHPRRPSALAVLARRGRLAQAFLVSTVLANVEPAWAIWIAYWVKLSNLKDDLMLDPGVDGRDRGREGVERPVLLLSGRLCTKATTTAACAARPPAPETGAAVPAAASTAVLAPTQSPRRRRRLLGGDSGAADTGAGTLPVLRHALIARTRSSARHAGRPAV